MIILPSYIIKSVFPPFIKLLLSALFFRQKRINKYKHLTVGIIKYYLNSIKRRTWKSNKLEYEKK